MNIALDGHDGSESAEGEFASQFVTLSGTDVAGLFLRTAPGSTISGRIRFDAPAPRSAPMLLEGLASRAAKVVLADR